MKTTIEKPELDLSDCDDNVFAILGRARRVGRKAGWGIEQITAFMIEAKSGHYDHVIQTCMKHFDVV